MIDDGAESTIESDSRTTVCHSMEMDQHAPEVTCEDSYDVTSFQDPDSGDFESIQSEEDVEDLALDIVNYLPADQANRFLRACKVKEARLQQLASSNTELMRQLRLESEKPWERKVDKDLLEQMVLPVRDSLVAELRLREPTTASLQKICTMLMQYAGWLNNESVCLEALDSLRHLPDPALRSSYQAFSNSFVGLPVDLTALEIPEHLDLLVNILRCNSSMAHWISLATLCFLSSFSRANYEKILDELYLVEGSMQKFSDPDLVYWGTVLLNLKNRMSLDRASSLEVG